MLYLVYLVDFISKLRKDDGEIFIFSVLRHINVASKNSNE